MCHVQEKRKDDDKPALPASVATLATLNDQSDGDTKLDLPDITPSAYITRREQLQNKANKKEANRRGRKKVEQGEDISEQEQPAKKRRTAAKSKPSKKDQSKDESARPKLRRTKNHVPEDIDAEALSTGASEAIASEPKKAKKTRQANPKKQSKAAKMASAGSKPAKKVRSKKAKAKSCMKTTKPASAKTKAKARAAPKSKGRAKENQEAPKNSKAAKTGTTQKKAKKEPASKNKVEASQDISLSAQAEMQVSGGQGLREKAKQEILNSLNMCWKAGEIDMKGKHKHAALDFDGKNELSLSVYWGRGAVGVKRKVNGKDSQVCYFSKNTHCCNTNIVLARLWVFKPN